MSGIAPGSSLPRSLARRLGVAALAGIAAFTAACVAVQFLRSDYDWLYAPLSFYLLGPYGVWVEATYFLLAAALACVGAGFYLALDRTARSAAPLLLFVFSSLALCVTALAKTTLPHQPVNLAGFVHVEAAVATFLCVTTAMLLQSWRLRGDAAWRQRFRPAFALAVVCFIAVWLDGLGHIEPRGLAEKILIALILWWLARSAWWLWRT